MIKKDFEKFLATIKPRFGDPKYIRALELLDETGVEPYEFDKVARELNPQVVHTQ